MLWAFFIVEVCCGTDRSLCGRVRIGKEESVMNNHSGKFAMLQLVSCALALLLLAGVMIFQTLEAKRTASTYDTVGSVVYRVEDDRTQGYQVSYRV